MLRARIRTRLALAALCALAGCTFITDANDRKLEEGNASSTRDLHYTFINMAFHQSQPLDVAIVNERDLLQGRARVILPPKSGDKYPNVLLEMAQALRPGTYRLLFFVDSNPTNNVVDSRPGNVLEHIWTEPVPPSGRGSFTHSFDFKFFTEHDYTNVGRDIVLELPGGAINNEAAKQCLRDLVDGMLHRILEVKIFLDERQVAYFATFPGNPLPDAIRLTGVVEAPSEYKIEVLVDGKQMRSFNREVMQADQDLSIAAAQWFPLGLTEALACLNPK